MVDSIQKTSTNPLPPHQTVTGQHDPLPVNGQEATQKVDDKQAESNSETSTTNFESYLNQQSILTLEKAQQGAEFDPASDIDANSTYRGSGQFTPV